MERKPLPSTARRDFQDQGGPSKQPHVWGQQNPSSNLPPQPQPLRYATPTQLPEAVHLADELQRSLRSSNNSTAATTSSSTNHSLSHLRHDPGAGPSTFLHDFNTIVLPLVFLISFSGAMAAMLVYTFAMNRVLPHRFTAVICIILVSILLTWGLCRWYEYCKARRRAGRLWGLQEKDIEKALRYSERSESMREHQSKTSTKSSSIRKSILEFLSPFFPQLFKQPLELPTQERKINEEHVQRNKRKEKRLSSVQIGGFGAGKYFQQDTREQFKLRESIKKKEKESRHQSRKQMLRPSFVVGDDVTFMYLGREGGNLMSKKGEEKVNPGEEGQRAVSFAVDNNFAVSRTKNGNRRKDIHGRLRHPLSIVTTLWQNACKDIIAMLPTAIAKRISGTAGLPVTTRSLSRTAYLYPSPSSTEESPTSSSRINHPANHHFHDEEKGTLSDLRWEGELPTSSFEEMGLGEPKPIPDDDRMGLNWSWKSARKTPSPPTAAQKGKRKEVPPVDEETSADFSSIPWETKPKPLFLKSGKPIPVSRVRFSQLETKPVRPHLQDFSAHEFRGESAFNGLLRQKEDVLIPTPIPALQVTSVVARIPLQSKAKDESGGNKSKNNPASNSPTTLLYRSRTHAVLCKPRSPRFRAKIYEEMAALTPEFCRLT